jgi:hypothetical protein
MDFTSLAFHNLRDAKHGDYWNQSSKAKCWTISTKFKCSSEYKGLITFFFLTTTFTHCLDELPFVTFNTLIKLPFLGQNMSFC